MMSSLLALKSDRNHSSPSNHLLRVGNLGIKNKWRGGDFLRITTTTVVFLHRVSNLIRNLSQMQLYLIKSSHPLGIVNQNFQSNKWSSEIVLQPSLTETHRHKSLNSIWRVVNPRNHYLPRAWSLPKKALKKTPKATAW